MIISFAGHSSITEKEKVKEIVKIQIKNNIDDIEPVMCYLGGYGDFDDLCAVACRELKSEYKNIEIVYVTPYFNLSEQKKIKEMQDFGLFDSSLYPPIENVPLRFAISKRNEWMMKSADFVIVYVKRNYGGAYNSFRIANRKKKKIINIFDLL